MAAGNMDHVRPGGVRRVASLAVTILAVLVFSGCGNSGVGGAPSTRPEAAATTATATTGTAQKAMTGQELVWLESVSKLHAKFDKALTEDKSTEMTTAVLRSLEREFRGFSHELDGLGVPTARLQPVSALVDKASEEYVGGAAYFATAARIGTPVGDADLHQFEQAIQRAYDTAGKASGYLADAEMKGIEIKTAANS